MASGNYPVHPYSEEGRKLVAAISLIKEVLRDFDYDGNQTDNAASDGAYRERLNVAIEMIRHVLHGI